MPTIVLCLFRFARLLFTGHAALAVENGKRPVWAAFPSWA
jgi:hypothetical protein